MGFKIRCQVGGWGTQFSKIPYVREFLNIWFQKSSFFFIFLFEFSHFFENLKNVISNADLKKNWFLTCDFFLYFYLNSDVNWG